MRWLCAAMALGAATLFAQDVVVPPLKADGAADVKWESLSDLLQSPDLWKINFQELKVVLQNLKGSKRSVVFADNKVHGFEFNFENEKLAAVRVSLSDEKSEHDLSDEDYRKRLDSCIQALDQISGVKGQDVSLTVGMLDRHLKTVVWIAEPTTYRLDYALSEGNKESHTAFAYLTFFKGDRNLSAEKFLWKGKISIDPKSLKDCVKSNAAGDVWLEVPMIQSDIGCAVDAMGRVGRYYGLDFNRYQWAQALGTKNSKSTDGASSLKKMRSFWKELGMDVCPLIDVEDRCWDIINRYNEQADKTLKPKLKTRILSKNNLDNFYPQMDRETFLASRQTSQKEQNQFMVQVSEKIKAGIPILWGMIYGFVEETPKGPQEIGGHFRLIIGFNERTSEILYSDSWGPGHELKRMKLKDASGVTFQMYTVEPMLTPIKPQGLGWGRVSATKD